MDLEKLILKGESENLEFKKSTGEWKEVIETISAFANTRSGKIFVGVSNTGKIIGVQTGKGTIENLTNACARLLEVSNDTALRELTKLRLRGVIAKKGIGRITYYVLK